MVVSQFIFKRGVFKNRNTAWPPLLVVGSACLSPLLHFPNSPIVHEHSMDGWGNVLSEQQVVIWID